MAGELGGGDVEINEVKQIDFQGVSHWSEMSDGKRRLNNSFD